MGDTTHLSLIELLKTLVGGRVFPLPLVIVFIVTWLSTRGMAAVLAQVDGIAGNHHTSSDCRSLYCRS